MKIFFALLSFLLFSCKATEYSEFEKKETVINYEMKNIYNKFVIRYEDDVSKSDIKDTEIAVNETIKFYKEVTNENFYISLDICLVKYKKNMKTNSDYMGYSEDASNKIYINLEKIGDNRNDKIDTVIHEIIHKIINKTLITKSLLYRYNDFKSFEEGGTTFFSLSNLSKITNYSLEKHLNFIKQHKGKNIYYIYFLKMYYLL